MFVSRAGRQLKAGEYAIPAQASMAAIAAILVVGQIHPAQAHRRRRPDQRHGLQAGGDDPDLVGDAGPEPAEGTLLPETYLFTRGTTRARTSRRAWQQRKRNSLTSNGPPRADGLPFTSPEQAVMLASIVEKETALARGTPPCRGGLRQPAEDRHEASVRSHHHLRHHQGLSAGPRIRESEIAGATPYNTYVIQGLPAGADLQSRQGFAGRGADPEHSNDLYFVANGKGGHVFAATVAEHQRNVAAWRAIERAKDACGTTAACGKLPNFPSTNGPRQGDSGMSRV